MYRKVIKRVLDIIISLAALIILSPFGCGDSGQM